MTLGRTNVGTHSAFDRSSTYFTYEGPLTEEGGKRNQAQTLVRVCKDGSNPTVVLEGVSINAAGSHLDAYSIDDLAVDDKRIYFTSNNAVYAIDK